jgi:anti-sigma factor RsiW
MTEDDLILRLNAALDGELDAMDALAFERELEADPTLAAEQRRLAALRDAVRAHAPIEQAPRALAQRIASLAGPAAPLSPRVSGIGISAWRPASPLALAASMAAIGFVLGAGLMSFRSPDAGGVVAQGLVSDYARAAIAGQPYDVASSDRHTVKPWLAGRTTVSADIVDLAAAGFPLAGGRVAVVDDIPAPTLVYRHNEHLIAVTELPPGAKGASGDGMETLNGYHVARWTDANLGYFAVSDMDEQTLREFVAAFRKARQPMGEDKSR